MIKRLLRIAAIPAFITLGFIRIIACIISIPIWIITGNFEVVDRIEKWMDILADYILVGE